MKLLLVSLLAIGLTTQVFAKEDAKQESSRGVEKKTEKRGVVEIQNSHSAYVTPSPLHGLPHGSTVLPQLSVTPGIIYAPQKQIIASASPSQLYAKPSPNLVKISDAVISGQPPYSGQLGGQIYQSQQVYQPQYAKVGFTSPSYSVSAPIPSQLAYSKHQVVPQQQVYVHQPQVVVAQPQQNFAAYSQPQANHYSQTQSYAQPQILQAHSQVHYTQPQVQYTQPQVQYPQPQVHYAQPQVQYSQPQVSFAHQPQLAFAHQPQVYQQQVAYQQPQVAAYAQPQFSKIAYAQPAQQQVYASQSGAGKGEGAVSYASFSQSHSNPAQYQPLAKQASYSVAPQQALVTKQVVTQAYQPQYYQQPQQAYTSHQQVYQPQPQVYQSQPQQLYASHSSPKVAYTQPQVAFAQPQASYSTQYFGKLAQANGLAYSGYNH